MSAIDMHFPKVVAAQRLQTLLLLTTFVAIILTALLFSDLISGFRSTVVADAEKSLSNAVKELLQANGGDSTAQQELQRLSYDVLRSYPDVEGGYIIGGAVVGHTFPTYTERGSELIQPPIERQAVLESVRESRQTGVTAHRIFEDNRDLVVVSALVNPRSTAAGWALKRYLNFNESRHLRRKLLLVALLVLALNAVSGGLILSYRMQRGFAGIQAGLSRLQTQPEYRLPAQQHELQPIVQAINEMAERRQSLEAELRREDRLRVMGRVVAGIAHEIRNPLNSIRLTVQMIARRMRGHAAAEESVPLVLHEVDRLDSLLKSLLVFGSEGSERLRRQPLLPVLQRTLALVTPHLNERGVTATVVAAPDLEVAADADHLQQALMNLLLNAADVSTPAGKIEITAEAVPAGVAVGIRDTGPGLTQEQQEHLFEAFYTTKPSGTGLGLAVTRTLLDRMGASIEYVAGPAPGAHFRVLLASPAKEAGACQRAS